MRPNFETKLSSVKDEIWVPKQGELNCCFCVVLGIEMSFDLIYYNCSMDARIESYNSLKLKPKLLTLYFISKCKLE